MCGAGSSCGKSDLLHFTCQMAMSLGRVGRRIVTRLFSSPGGWGLGTRLTGGPTLSDVIYS